MADQSAQDQLYDHYGDMQLRLVDEPTGGGPGLSLADAKAFLRRLRPVTRAKTSLADAAKKAATKG